MFVKKMLGWVVNYVARDSIVSASSNFTISDLCYFLYKYFFETLYK